MKHATLTTVPSIRHRGFTLIELLVVIAIIALLIGILLPALAKARNVARMTKSLAQMKNLPTALQAYMADNRNIMPMPQADGFTATGALTNGNAMPWAFAGAYCNARWAAVPGVDTPPANRALNHYISPDTNYIREYTVTNSTRKLVQIPVLRSPGDNATVWDFYAALTGAGTGDGNTISFNPNQSGYDDVGTSYLMNDLYWQYWLAPGATTSPTTVTRQLMIDAVVAASKYLNSSAGEGSKTVMFYDQTAFAITRGPTNVKWRGEFGEDNRSVTGFFDGRAEYLEYERKTVPGLSMTGGPGLYLAAGRGFFYSGRTNSGQVLPYMRYSLMAGAAKRYHATWGIQ